MHFSKSFLHRKLFKEIKLNSNSNFDTEYYFSCKIFSIFVDSVEAKMIKKAYSRYFPLNLFEIIELTPEISSLKYN